MLFTYIRQKLFYRLQEDLFLSIEIRIMAFAGFIFQKHGQYEKMMRDAVLGIADAVERIQII